MSTMVQEKRWRTYAVHRRTIAALLIQDAKVETVEGAPRDATFVGMSWDESRDAMLVTLAHPTFADRGSDNWQNVVPVIHSAQHRVTLQYPLPNHDRSIRLSDLAGVE